MRPDQGFETLERALDSNRDIGVAMGIPMTRHPVTQEQAFDLLRLASQHGHRKLVEVAQDVITAGDLAVPHAAAGRPLPDSTTSRAVIQDGRDSGRRELATRGQATQVAGETTRRTPTRPHARVHRK